MILCSVGVKYCVRGPMPGSAQDVTIRRAVEQLEWRVVPFIVTLGMMLLVRGAAKGLAETLEALEAATSPATRRRR